MAKAIEHFDNDFEILSDLSYSSKMDKDFKMYRELITIGQRIKQLKLDKPSNYKRTVCSMRNLCTLARVLNCGDLN